MSTMIGFFFTQPTLKAAPYARDEQGLHFSILPWHALEYDPSDGSGKGVMLHKVRCGGTVVIEKRHGRCTQRTILASFDATHLLRRFAADQALSVAQFWDMPEIVRSYLETLDETKRWAAWEAAFWAANTETVLWTASRSAAWAAVGAASSDPRGAADALRNATQAPWCAAGGARHYWEPARDWARDDAWAAAKDAARADFDARVYRAFDSIHAAQTAAPCVR